MFTQPCPPEIINEGIHLFIDPAAGGPHSDYAVVSITRTKGLISVSPREQPRAGRIVTSPHEQPRADLPPARDDIMRRRPQGPRHAPHWVVVCEAQRLLLCMRMPAVGCGGPPRAVVWIVVDAGLHTPAQIQQMGVGPAAAQRLAVLRKKRRARGAPRQRVDAHRQRAALVVRAEAHGHWVHHHTGWRRFNQAIK